MAYGITVISWSNTDIWFEEIIKDIVISNNDLTINSQTGAIGIGAQSSDVKITDNKVTINAHADAQVTANPDPVFGDDSNAITILNFNEVLGYYYNTTVTDNIITTNVPAIFIDKTKGNGYYSPEPIVIEDNTVTYTGAVEYTIDDDHYFLFFNDDGTSTDLLNPEGNYALKLGNLTNKVIKIISMVLYLLLGWMIIFTPGFLYIPFNSFIWVLIGGILYTIGAVTYGIGHKNLNFHGVFHVFTLLGTITQGIGVILLFI